MSQPTTRSPHEPADSAAPAQPPARPRSAPGPSRRKWVARLIVLILVAAAVLLFLRITAGRKTDATHIALGTVTLTAQAIPVDTPRPGQVTAVLVTAQQRVSDGQRLGTLRVTSIDAQGDPVLSTLTLTAPRAGVVVDEPVTVGSTLQPGQPFVTLYDPAKLTFITDVPLRSLTQIAPGMRASLSLEPAGTADTVKATVQRVVPRVTGGTADAAAPGSLRMVLVPAAGQDTTGLLPGLRFTGTVDTLTGPPGTPRFVPGG